MVDTDDDLIVAIECEYGGPDHEYPLDWKFGGANGMHPGVDPRFKPCTYEYYDAKLLIIDTTCVPLCDDEAIDRFTQIAAAGPGFVPVHVSVRRPDGSLEMLKVRYDKETDTAYDIA